MLAWCRSLAGRQPLGLGEDVGRVAGSVARVQQLGELHGHDGNYGGSAMAKAVARKIHATGLRSRCIAANWCSTFRCLQVLLLVAPWRVLGLGSRFLLVVKLVVEKALEADPSWCSGKPNAAVWLLELAGHVAMV